MHLHLGELLLSAAYIAAALIVLVGIFRSGNMGVRRHEAPPRRQMPPIKRIANKRDDDENDRKVA